MIFVVPISFGLFLVLWIVQAYGWRGFVGLLFAGGAGIIAFLGWFGVVLVGPDAHDPTAPPAYPLSLLIPFGLVALAVGLTGLAFIMAGKEAKEHPLPRTGRSRYWKGMSYRATLR